MKEAVQGSSGAALDTDLDAALDQEENLDWLLASLGCGMAGAARGSVDSAELSVVAQVRPPPSLGALGLALLA